MRLSGTVDHGHPPIEFCQVPVQRHVLPIDTPNFGRWSALLLCLKVVFLQPKKEILQMERARVETCGSKVSACAQLTRVSKDAQFKTPAGVCLPFGNMEYAIKVPLWSPSLCHPFLLMLQIENEHGRRWWCACAEDEYGAIVTCVRAVMQGFLKT